MANCTTAGSGSDNENKIVHVGERVYLRSSQSSSREGEGFVTSVSGSGYTLEITDRGDLRYNDRIEVYRDSKYRTDDCIGSGTVSRIDPVAVTAEGHVLAVHVQDGQRVSRGDLLFETVPDALVGMRGGDSVLAMPEDGVVLSVAAQDGARAAKDDALLVYCPQGALELVCAADEDDLASVAVGDTVSVVLDAYPARRLSGTVAAISGVGASEGGRVTYDVRSALEDRDGLARIGMSATAEK